MQASSESDLIEFNPGLFGISEGTRVPVDLQQELMKNYPKIMQHVAAQKERSQSAYPRRAFSRALYSGVRKAINRSKVAKGLSKGIGKLIKKVATGHDTKQAPTGSVCLAGGGFSFTECFSASDLNSKMKKASAYSSGSGGKEGKGNTNDKMLNSMISSGLDLAGVG